MNEVARRVAGRRPGPQYTLPLARTAAELAIAKGDPDTAWQEVAAALDRPGGSAGVASSDGVAGSDSLGVGSDGPGGPADSGGTVNLPGYDLPLLAVGAWALEMRARRDGAAGAGAAGGASALVSAADAGAVRTSAVHADAELLRQRMDDLGGWGPAEVWRAVLDAHLAGLDGDATAAPDAWRRVLDTVEAAGGPAHLRPYAGYRLGEALATLGHREPAAEALRQAAEHAGRLGAGLVRGWIDDLSRRARLPLLRGVTTGADRHGDQLGLTEREHEVLRLVAAGRSNRQIGEELFISAKTASVHVSNILTKLGVSGRGEAAAVAHRAGLFDDEPVSERA